VLRGFCKCSQKRPGGANGSSSGDAKAAAQESGPVQRSSQRRSLAVCRQLHEYASTRRPLHPVANSVYRSMALETANRLYTPLVEIKSLFPLTVPCQGCSIPDEWTSPLTCQWHSEVSKSSVENRMILLAGFVGRWLSTFVDSDSYILAPTRESLKKRAILRQEIEWCIILHDSLDQEAISMYESCRWAALILLAVEKMGVPIHVAAKHVQMRPRLCRRLRMTDLSSLWGMHKGLLFWVTTTCQFATAGQCFPLLSTTILARLTQEMAVLDCCSDIAIKPLKRLKTFESLCCRL
jgi:hypothetical protein